MFDPKEQCVWKPQGRRGHPRRQVVTERRDGESTQAKTGGLRRDADQKALSGFGVYVPGN